MRKKERKKRDVGDSDWRGLWPEGNRRKLLLTTIAGSDGVDVTQMVLSGPNRLCDLRAWSTTRQILLSNRFLDPVHLVLVALAISHCTFLGVAQRRLQGLDALHRRPQSFLQFRQLAAEVCVIPNELFVHL